MVPLKTATNEEEDEAGDEGDDKEGEAGDEEDDEEGEAGDEDDDEEVEGVVTESETSPSTTMATS